MDDSHYLEEEVTRSNFVFMVNHNLDVKGSMGLFPDKITTSDISAIERHDSTQQFYLSKSSTSSVFDRLVQDTNRRTMAGKKVNDYRRMLQIEYENSFLSQAKITRDKEENLLTRLIEDTKRRCRRYEALKELKQQTESPPRSVKWPINKTQQVVSRLSVDSRQRFLHRESLLKNIEDEEAKIFQKIRDQRHPKRGLDFDVFHRITGLASSSCRHSSVSQEVIKSAKSAKDMKNLVERLHKRSSLKLFVPYLSPENSARTKSSKRSPSPKKKIDVDDYIMKLKEKLQKNQ